jgi:hypothetical protein
MLALIERGIKGFFLKKSSCFLVKVGQGCVETTKGILREVFDPTIL